MLPVVNTHFEFVLFQCWAKSHTAQTGQVDPMVRNAFCNTFFFLIYLMKIFYIISIEMSA